MLRSLLVGLIAGCLAVPPTAAHATAPRPRGMPAGLAVDANCSPLPARTWEHIPWQTGEKLAYDIDVMGARAGKLAMVALPSVGKGASGEYPLRALAASNSFFSKIRKVRGRATSYVRASDMHPRRYEEATREGRFEKAADVVFKRRHEGRRIEIDYRRNNARRQSKERILHEAFDPVSAVYYLRTLDYREGMEVCFDAYAIRKLWRVSGKVKGLETVKVPAGVFEAWHLEGVAIRTDRPSARREVHVWISNDERRLPVASLGVIDLGAVRAQLTHVGEGSDKDSENALLPDEPSEPESANSTKPPAPAGKAKLAPARVMPKQELPQPD